jgi:hypothetical protein
MLCKVELNKTLVFNILRFFLATIFLYMFVIGLCKFFSDEIGTKITIDENGGLVLPSFSICPYYSDNSSGINPNGNYTAEDVEKLPSLMDVIDAELQIYGSGIIGNIE